MTDKDPDLPADDIGRPDPDDPLADFHLPDHDPDDPPATTEAAPATDEPKPPATTEVDPAGDDDLLVGEPDTSTTVPESALPGHDPYADDQALLADPVPADDPAARPVAGGADGVERVEVRERPPARRRSAAMVGAAALLLAALAGSFALGRASADDDSSPAGLAGTSGPPGWHDDDGPRPDQGPGWPGRQDDGDRGSRSDWGDGIHWPSRGESRHGPPPSPDDGAQQDD